ncbi:glycosidase [Pyrolobus fumarii]|uniref:glycoside hydrolase family 130 protein n=1 Tax=Pyrolobus fumarii TaxID=54252 RepID=UPI001FCA8EAE|nr:glycosidase [Pyrolobus fumarii]
MAGLASALGVKVCALGMEAKFLRDFPLAEHAAELGKLRHCETHDIFQRLGVLTPQRVHLKNHPLANPLTVFNAALDHGSNGDMLVLYPRIIIGYFKYASAIAEVELPLEDLYTGSISISHYPAEIIVYPSTSVDIWGSEDPRVTRIDGTRHMVYVGRTINYFEAHIRRERTLPVLAVEAGRHRWVKVGYFVLPERLRPHVISDKDAFLVQASNGDLLLFHRPHMDDENFYLTISIVPHDEYKRALEEAERGEPVPIRVRGTRTILPVAPFEEKLGWASPPVMVERDTFLTLVHAVDVRLKRYRIFAMLVRYDRDVGPRPIAVTPRYIMEPRAMYEVYGDRPFTVFPCGAVRHGDRLIISYGAADSVVGFAEAGIDDIMAELDHLRLE